MFIGFRSHSKLPVASLLAAGFLLSSPASAQDEDYQRIVTIMRACAQIEDVMARVTCYDNNITRSPSSSASAGPRPAVSAPPPQAAPAPQGFGAEMIQSARREEEAQRADEVELRVSASRQLRPGIFVLTMVDGAEWQFTDSAPLTYDEPRAGDTVRLERGSLGSVFLHFGGQGGLRVRRIR